MSADAITVQQALRAAQAQGLARIDAQLLLLHTLGRDRHDRAWLISHDQDALPASAAERWAVLVKRRAAGEPLAYLTGSKAFYGLELHIDARVLDPRPDTETLVDWALELIPQLPLPAPLSVIDLGTGSGAIALALKSQRPDLQVSAVDTSPDALAVAQTNGQRLGLDVDWRLGSWLEGITDRFALIVSNPPYIADADPHMAALHHEPRQALTSGPDGLDDIRQIVAQAPAHLHPGGWLLLEHGWDQAEAVRTLLTQAGWTQVQSRRDLAGVERCTGGCWAGR